jgi:hypothetical protein
MAPLRSEDDPGREDERRDEPGRGDEGVLSFPLSLFLAYLIEPDSPAGPPTHPDRGASGNWTF